MDYESADRWNQLHPPGTRVCVRLVDGSGFEAKTRAAARQWGNFAIVPLAGCEGMWTTTAMTAIEETALAPEAAVEDPPICASG